MELKIINNQEVDKLRELAKQIGSIHITGEYAKHQNFINLILACHHFMDNATEYEIISFIGVVTAYMIPTITSIPKEDLSKIQEFSNYISELNHKYIYEPKAPIVDEEVIRKEVVEIIRDHLRVNENQITLESNLVEDLGADDLDPVEIIMALEEKYKITITEEDAETCHLVKDCVQLVIKLIKKYK